MKNLKIFTENVEDKAKEQIDLLLEQEAFKNCKVRIMPDVHAGSGCVIGFTADLGDKVIPNVVGVDIGCGMLCVKLGKIDLDLKKLDEVIRNNVPSGRNVSENLRYKFNELRQIKCLNKLKNPNDYINKALGTLGGGNHFIEIDEDKENNKYLVIHTGSRNLGKQVAEYYQDLAIKYCSYENEVKQQKKSIIELYKKSGKQKEIQEALKTIDEAYKDKTKLPKELCYLEADLRKDYLHDMRLCQIYAQDNRKCIARQILCNYFQVPYYEGYESVRLREEAKPNCLETQDMIKYDFRYFESIHNYINFEDNIVRKGAISARRGEKVIIPMNMKDGCIIGIGKGNNDWNQSAPHGAGRIMSRIKARETLNMKDYENSMKGIYTTSVNNQTIDEAPMAYKPMQEIINNIKDTVEVIKIIKPIYNFKANE